MGSITSAAAAPDTSKLCNAGGKVGLTLPTEFYTSYHRSPLATPAADADGAATPRTPLAAAAAAAASAVASKSVAEASAAAAGGASALHRPVPHADSHPLAAFPQADDAVAKIMRGNGLSLAALSARTAVAPPCEGTGSPSLTHCGSSIGPHMLRSHYGGLWEWPGVPLSSGRAWTLPHTHHPREGSTSADAVAAERDMPDPSMDGGKSKAETGHPARPSREVVLSLEMFERDVQHVVDEYCGGIISARDLAFVRPPSSPASARACALHTCPTYLCVTQYP